MGHHVQGWRCTLAMYVSRVQFPSAPQLKGGLAQLARASALQAEGHRFESVNLHMNQKRTTEFKVRAYELYKKGTSPKEAFTQACKEFGTMPSGCMTNYATSYMWDYKIWIKEQVQKENKEVIELLERANIGP